MSSSALPPRPAQQPSSPARDLALIAVFAGIIAVLGLFPAFYPFGAGVPITLQNLGVLLCGALLGPRRGTGAVLLFCALVLLGLPLLTGGRGGLGVLASPTVGYFLGFPVAAWAVGWATYRLGAPYRLWQGVLINLVGGTVLLHIPGFLGLLVKGRSVAAAWALTATFLPGDVLKAVLAAVVAKGVHQAYPGLLPRRADRPATPAEQVVAPPTA